MGSVNCRHLLGWAGARAALSAVILAGVILGSGLTPGSAEAEKLTLEVAPDLSTFDAVREVAPGHATPTGPFYITGPIFPEGTLKPDGTAPSGAKSIGTFRCWGWIFDGSKFPPLAVVSQEFKLDDRGNLQVQGREDERRAVTGGTGDFRHVRGEGRFTPLNPTKNLSFRATFTLKDTKK